MMFQVHLKALVHLGGVPEGVPGAIGGSGAPGRGDEGQPIKREEKSEGVRESK